MVLRASTLLVCLLLASVAEAETVYKYRHADGKVTYSNRRLPGLELIETFEVRFPAPAPAAVAKARQATPADEARISKRLSALDTAWSDVQKATRELDLAEQRLAAGAEPQGGERQAIAVATAPSEAGGVPAAVSPALGGSMSGRRSRPSPEYVARVEALEAEVQKARARLEVALHRYNELR